MWTLILSKIRAIVKLITWLGKIKCPIWGSPSSSSSRYHLEYSASLYTSGGTSFDGINKNTSEKRVSLVIAVLNLMVLCCQQDGAGPMKVATIYGAHPNGKWAHQDLLAFMPWFWGGRRHEISLVFNDSFIPISPHKISGTQWVGTKAHTVAERIALSSEVPEKVAV